MLGNIVQVSLNHSLIKVSASQKLLIYIVLSILSEIMTRNLSLYSLFYQLNKICFGDLAEIH